MICLPSLQSLGKLRESMLSCSLLLQFLIGFVVLSGLDGATIERLEIPVAIRNGSGPVDLICVYNVHESENGLVVKWYHNEQQIYMWIPPMEPQDLGIIAGLTSYTPEIMNRPQSHSIIRLKKVTLNMSGEYICSVSTFGGRIVSKAKMTIYVREKMLTLQATDVNKTHVNIGCLAIGARPLPILKMLVASMILMDPLINDNYPNDAVISTNKIIEKPRKATIMECQIQIPGTGYGYRNIHTYWPTIEEQQESINALQLISNSTSRYQVDFLCEPILLFCYSIWIYKSIFLSITTAPMPVLQYM